MDDKKGFLKVKREAFGYRPVNERVRDYKDVAVRHSNEKTEEQASRCMDCGTPFCNWGCPLGNYIPEWNDHVFRSRFEGAYKLLSATNPLPEITGRVCPAPCEFACVLGITDKPVTIRDNELSIIEEAFEKGYVRPEPMVLITGKRVAVIGSGPAGLSAAAELNRKGHNVTVFEKAEALGGFLRFGIPDFKLEKNIIERRVNIWKQEGIKFLTGVNAGTDDYPAEKLLKNFDAICIAAGCRVARDLPVPGRELSGIYQAVDYLTQSNQRVAGKKFDEKDLIDANGKNVIVIGGGDTGADCVGTANRQGAKSVVQVEILPEPPKERPRHQPWPAFPVIYKTSTSHEEGADRNWSVMTKRFKGENNRVRSIDCVKCEFVKEPKPGFRELEGTGFELKADMAILSMGFTNPEKELLEKLNIRLNNRGTVERDEHGRTSADKIFAAGDVVRGPSLVVWAIAEGKKAAMDIDEFLKNHK